MTDQVVHLRSMPERFSYDIRILAHNRCSEWTDREVLVIFAKAGSRISILGFCGSDECCPD